MCGIAGIVGAHDLPPGDRHRVVAMRDVLAHRGPDDAGLFVDGQAALGHRRLSIVDLGGGQAAAVERRRDHLDQLQRRDLQPPRPQARARRRRAHVYRTRSDTETHRPRLRGVGRRLRRPPARHVRVRDLGFPASPSAHRARSPRRQAALLGAHAASGCSSRPRSKGSSRAG